MKPRISRKPLLLPLVAVLALAVLPGCVLHSTGTTEVGVRTIKWSPLGNRGVQEEIYPPGGTYFFLPFINDWHTFDTRLHNLEMTAVEMRGDRPGRDDLLFKTIDGNDISLDVIISYKIVPEEAPKILQEVAANDEDLKESVVRTVARSKPRDIFGELNTEQMYSAEERTKKEVAAREALNEIFKDYGIVVERVGTRDYRFNPEYQKAIQDKKVADQLAEKHRAETKAVEEEYRMKVEEAKGDIAKIEAEADGEYERAVIEADAYYEQQAQIAQAIEAEGRAEAEGIREMNEALSGPGAANMVKLKLAEALQGKRIVLLPTGGGGLDVRSTDVNALLELYGIQRLIEPRTPSQPQVKRPATPSPQRPAVPTKKD